MRSGGQWKTKSIRCNDLALGDMVFVRATHWRIAAIQYGWPFEGWVTMKLEQMGVEDGDSWVCQMLGSDTLPRVAISGDGVKEDWYAIPDVVMESFPTLLKFAMHTANDRMVRDRLAGKPERQIMADPAYREMAASALWIATVTENNEFSALLERLMQ